ncbi:MAG: toxin-antitoxin system YwqK family antitoxin [Bacteroidia bacterium]
MYQMCHRIPVIILLIALSNFSFAQNRQKGSYMVYLNGPLESIKAEVVFENRKVNVKDDLTYSWYTSNKIIETKGGFDGRLLSGSYTSFYLSDNLKEQGHYENGLKDDQWKTWFENGKLKEISGWSNGVKSGNTRRYDSQGNLVYEARYSKGKLSGYEITYDGEKIISKKKYAHGKEIIPKAPKISTADSAKSAGKFHLFDKREKNEMPSGQKKIKKEKTPERREPEPLAEKRPKKWKVLFAKKNASKEENKKKKTNSVASNEKAEK